MNKHSNSQNMVVAFKTIHVDLKHIPIHNNLKQIDYIKIALSFIFLIDIVSIEINLSPN